MNPKKSIFAVTEGKLLGFVVSKQGINIDPERTQTIAQISMPHSKKTMQSFLGKINFVSRFIPGFTEIVRPLQKMIKKDAEFKWSVEEKKSFHDILKAISEAPTLTSPDFSKPFILYTFASDSSYDVVLT